MKLPSLPAWEAKDWRRLHLALTMFWTLAIIPTLLIWSQSILWLALMSCWANLASHFAAWQGTRAEEQNES